MSGTARIGVAVLISAGGAAVAAWQYSAYRGEADLIDESLHNQAHSVTSAVIGGMNSHRRFGFNFSGQLQEMLGELVKAKDVLAVAIKPLDGPTAVAAGAVDQLEIDRNSALGAFWTTAGFQTVEVFHLEASEGGGFGRGYGRGFGARMGNNRGSDDSATFSEGDYQIVLLLDSKRATALKQHALRSHVLIAASSWLLIGVIALGWRASVRAVAARGKAEVLETEAKHLRELSQAAAGLAHETRNPLGLIRGWTQRLAEEDGDETLRRQYAHAVIEECDRLTARINQFLTFAKPQDVRPTRVNLKELIAELSLLLQPDMEAKNIKLETQLFDGCAEIDADRELLRQALFNLIQNAVQFSPTASAVSVVAICRDQRCAIEVQDRGPGVADKIAKSLFTPYVTTRPEGTGIGLAIVRKIATLHNWAATYRPRDGGGAVFTLEGMHG
jgi:signal transduction histidine kinase